LYSSVNYCAGGSTRARHGVSGGEAKFIARPLGHIPKRTQLLTYGGAHAMKLFFPEADAFRSVRGLRCVAGLISHFGPIWIRRRVFRRQFHVGCDTRGEGKARISRLIAWLCEGVRHLDPF